MIGLYTEIESALNTIVDGLEYDFMKDVDINEVDDDKMKALTKSKTEALIGAKKIINRWLDSPNKPSDKKIVEYVERVIKAGDKAIKILRRALSKEIDYKKVDSHKHAAALSAKPLILESIFEIDSNMTELRDKLESGDLTFKDREFVLGYPELYANGKLFKTNYYKQRLTEDSAVIICPRSTQGDRITIDGLDIILPSKPKFKNEILFHDLPKEKQKWTRLKEPNITTSNVENYKDYIVEEYKRRVDGVWFYNNGKPTYITGNHYFAMQHCKMLDDGGYMNFRVAQQRLFYFMEACLVDPRCLGMLFGKSRRTGFTYAAIFATLNRATKAKNTKHGMMSKSGADGAEAFAKMTYAFMNLPFWLRPVVRGKLDSPNELFFGQPVDNSREKKKTQEIEISDYFNTSIDWRNTKNSSYDSIKLDTYILDEIFKIEKPNDVVVHLSMVAPTMMPNGRVVGKMLAGSTMGVHAKGGEQGIELITGSKVQDRDKETDKTSTGLYFHFLPAQENMEEFTDVYGKCWTTTPPKGTINVFGKEITKGSEEYLIAIENQKRKQSDTAYNEQVRTYPRTVEYMMRNDSNQCVFNSDKLQEQIDHNNTHAQETLYTIGNLDWADGEDSDVVFYPNRNGRFKIAWMPSVVDGTQHLSNRVKKINGSYFPLNKDLIRFGCDPFSLKSTHGEGSKGALHGLSVLFPEGGCPANTFVLEYIARPSDETIFFEDVIKCVRFYGSPILVESNRIDLLRHMRNRGYRGFVMDRLDRHKHKLNPNEVEYGGQPMSSKDILDSHMNSIGSWIEKYVGISTNPETRDEGEMGGMLFNETLVDWLRFNPEDRTKFDATISSGLAIMACRIEKYKGEKKKENTHTPVVASLLRKYTNNGDVSQKYSRRR